MAGKPAFRSGQGEAMPLDPEPLRRSFHRLPVLLVVVALALWLWLPLGRGICHLDETEGNPSLSSGQFAGLVEFMTLLPQPPEYTITVV